MDEGVDTDETLRLNTPHTEWGVFDSVASEGFEPPKASPADLQSDPFGRLGNSPWAHKVVHQRLTIIRCDSHCKRLCRKTLGSSFTVSAGLFSGRPGNCGWKTPVQLFLRFGCL